ncbi:MAG: hypothetical protein JSU86_20320, partial [Phycisphaerales bacterium]
FLAAIGFLHGSTVAGRPGVGIAQPKNYVSPSGAYTLFVDPADRYGRGGAKYRLSKSGVEVWSGEKPYTLREVVLTDEGLAAGFAYRTGSKRDEAEPSSFFEGGPQNPPEYVHVVILNAQGEEVLNDMTERMAPPHTNPPLPARPYLEQLLVDRPNDRVVARVVARGARWWIYRLSTGASLARLDPRELTPDLPHLKYVVEARLLPDTPLILVHWYTKGPDYKVKDAGAVFALVDLEAGPVWSFQAENDYADIKFGWRRYGGGTLSYFKKHPAILNTSVGGRFDLRLFAENKQASFVARQNDDGSWTVTELGRIDILDDEEAKSTTATRPAKPLPYLGELRLGTADAEESPFRSLTDFTFDNQGRVYFVKRSQEQPWTLYCADVTGKIISDRQFEWGSVDWTQTARMKDGKFFVSRSKKREDGDGYESSSEWVELSTGREEPTGLEISRHVGGVSRFPDGSYLVLDTLIRSSGAVVDRLTRYNSDGSTQWQLDNYEERQKLGLGPRDVVVTTDGRIVLLEMSYVRILDGEGDLIRKIDLTGAFGTDDSGGRPSYLHEVVADNDGGFLIADSSNPPVVLRYKADGSLRSRWSPRHPNGKTFNLRPDIRVAPDGRLWTGDGNSIMRLTDEGVVDLVLGPKPQANRLERIAAFTLDQQGNLYAVAHGSGVVHVFDRNGTPMRIIEPDPTDVPGTVKESFIAVKDDGEVYVKKPRTKAYMPPDEYLRFSPAGDRLETITFEPSIPVGRFLSSGWAFQPKTGYRCGICQIRGDTRLVIVDPPSTLIREVRKRPNGMWFGNRTGFAMAPNGSMAIHNQDILDEKRVDEVDLFSAEGDPIRTMRLPPPREFYMGIAYDGRRVVVAGDREVVVLDTADDSIERWSLTNPGATEARWSAFIMPDSDELLLFDRRGRKLHRYELPSVGAKVNQKPAARDADVQKPFDPSVAVIRSDWVKKYLDVLAALPEPGPCVVYIQKIERGEQALTEAQAMELPEEERSALRTMNLDDGNTPCDAPRVFARLLDIFATTGIERVEGLKILDFGLCSIRHLGALARLGVNVVGAQTGCCLTHMCSDWEEMGDLTGPDGQVGHLEVINARTFHREAEVCEADEGYDLITFRNLLQKVPEEDYFSPEPWTQTSLGTTKEGFLQRIYDTLSPGGHVLSYSVGVDPFIAENAIDKPLWESAGFQVIAFDHDDRGAALGIGMELGWDEQATPLEENVRAMYTLLKKLGRP